MSVFAGSEVLLKSSEVFRWGFALYIVCEVLSNSFMEPNKSNAPPPLSLYYPLSITPSPGPNPTTNTTTGKH